MSGAPLHYNVGGTIICSRFWKIFHSGEIKYVLLKGFSRDTTTISGQILCTLKEYGTLSHQAIPIRHDSPTTKNMIELILCQKVDIIFDLNDKINEICVHDYRTFDEAKNIGHVFGRKKNPHSLTD